MSVLSDIIAKLESGGGVFASLQPPSMVNPTFGQYRGFVNQYGSGAAGVDNFAQQVLAANPNATLGDFYATYVLGTGNPAHLYSPGDLQNSLVPGAQGAYNNLVSNAGVPLSTPLSQLVGGSGGGSWFGGAIDNAIKGVTGAVSGAVGGAAQGAISSAGSGIATNVETWLTDIGGSIVFVVIGVVLVLGALFIFAANEGSQLANTPAGRLAHSIAGTTGAVEA